MTYGFYAARDYACLMQPHTKIFFPSITLPRPLDSHHQFISTIAILNTNMSLVGALLFCNDCGGLLERCPASQANIDCDVCGKRNKSEFFDLFLPSVQYQRQERAE